MGIHGEPLLIYGVKIGYLDIKKIIEQNCGDYEENYGFDDFFKKHNILRVSPYNGLENEYCNWYYQIHKFKSSYTFQEPISFRTIDVPEYDRDRVKHDLLNLGIKNYKIRFYLDVDIG